LQPQSCTLADCGQLRRLKVCKSQRGQIAVLTRESGEAVDHDCEFFEDESESGTDEDKVRVTEITSWKIGKRSSGFDRTYSVT
jgi:hypothetical protein